MAFSRAASCSLSSVVCFTTNACGSRFFERQAVALERKALPLECRAQRIEMPERQRAEVSFEALDDLLAGQRLDRGHAHNRGDHLVAQRARAATFMADLDQQADHTPFAPRVGPVVDRLSAHTEFRTDGHRTQLAACKHQQCSCPRAHVLVRVIDRQLLLGLLLDFSQYNDALHARLRHMRFAEVNKLQSRLPAAPIIFNSN